MSPLHDERSRVMQAPSFLSGDSLTRLLQGIALGFVLTVAIGFNWAGAGFGWMTGGTAEKVANKRVETALIAVLAPICAANFLAQPDIAAKKAAFEKVDSWKRRNELPKEATTLPGDSYQNSDLVDACSAEILKGKVAAAK
jgi:cytochrome c biogenesis protein CcdA